MTTGQPKENTMRTSTRKPKNKYMPTYDYSQVGNWSMSSEEAKAIMNEASRLSRAGDKEGFYREANTWWIDDEQKTGARLWERESLR